MNLITGAIILVTIVSDSFALNFGRFLWIGKPSKTTEEAQLVEMIRWRQPVCLMPAEGVSPCIQQIKKFQKDYEQLIGKELLVNDEEAMRSVSSDEVIATPPISEEFITEKSSESQFRTSELTEDEERKVREGKLLSSIGEKKKIQQIYVTKVLNSPMTATLVAYGCVPDIGVPLCQNHQASVQPTKPVFQSKPSLTISIAEKPVIDYVKPTKGSLNGNAHQSSSSVTDKPSESIEQGASKPQIIIRDPSNEELSTRFVLEDSSPTKATTKFEEVRKPGVISNLAPSKLNFFGKASQKPVSDQSVKAELSVELSQESGSDAIETLWMPEGGSQLSKNNPSTKEHRIFQTIRDIVNKTEKSKIVQTLQNILRRPPSEQKTGDSSGLRNDGGSGLNNPFRTEDNGTATEPELSTDNGEDTLDEKSMVEENFHKPLMDSFEKSEMKMTETSGSLENPVESVEDKGIEKIKNDRS